MSKHGAEGVTLQVGVTPADLPHARETLPHQLRQWGAQVDEILFTLDLGPGGRRREPAWEQLRQELESLLAGICADRAHARVVAVDYAPAMQTELSRCFFRGRRVPGRDCHGKVVYPYFFGLWAARHRYLLHLDADMMFGGGSQAWVAEALKLFASRPDLFSCSPLPGPPSAGGLTPRVRRGHAGSGSRKALAANARPLRLETVGGPALSFTRLSTRDFMIDRNRLGTGGPAIGTRRPDARGLVAAVLKGSVRRGDPRYAPAEVLLSRAMSAGDMHRIDFLGSGPGMWSLHPPVHSASFIHHLPTLIHQIEAGAIPAGQRGDYDLNASMLPPARSHRPARRPRMRLWV